MREARTAQPKFIADELSRRREYPNGIALDPPELSVRYRRGRRQRVAYSPRLCERHVFAWIERKRRRVGAIELYEYTADPDISSDEFIDVMDGSSGIQAELAEVLVKHWGEVGGEIFASGSLVEFRAAWIEPGACIPEAWVAAAEAVIHREFGEHVLMLLKAFPLEFEGVGDGMAAAQKRRQRAMLRHYGRLLSVDPLIGDDEWMWRSNGCCFTPKEATGQTV